MPWKVALIIALVLTGVSGCASIGPGTVARDRFDYITAISDSWKSQMLLNLVKIRYGDAPVFLDVASVINQYAIEGSIGYTGSWAQNNQLPWPWNSLHSWANLGRYTDRPTITYSPLSGERFIQRIWCSGSACIASTAYQAVTAVPRDCAKPIPNSILWWKDCEIFSSAEISVCASEKPANRRRP